MKHFITILFTISATFASVTLTIESLTTQNEYVTTYSGSVYLQGNIGDWDYLTFLVLAWV